MLNDFIIFFQIWKKRFFPKKYIKNKFENNFLLRKFFCKGKVDYCRAMLKQI